jgi:hypothetical protein
MWRLEDGGTVRLLLSEQEGILPWLVVTIDATVVQPKISRWSSAQRALALDQAGVAPRAIDSHRRRLRNAQLTGKFV